jgi:hypothetical protein
MTLELEMRHSMKKSMSHKIKEDEDVTDIIAKFIAFMAIPASVFVIGFTLWTIF